MANNYTTSIHGIPGTGGVTITFASDDVGGVHYQIHKLAYGADDSATLVTTSSGLPVNIVASSGADGAILDGADGGIKATVLDYASSNPLAVRLTDTGGDYVAAGAGTQYTEDAAAAANPVGGALILVREDARAGSLTTTDGDNVAARGNNKGEQYVIDTDAVALLTTIDADTGGILTSVQALDNAISGSEMQVDVVGALPAGTNAIGKLAANSGVDIGDVDVTSIVPGTGATNLGKAEDGAHTSGDTGVQMLGVRTDTPNVARADTDLDYTPIATYRTGSVRTAIPEDDFAALGSNHVKKYYANTGAVTDGIVWSPAAGKRWYVTDLILTISAAATVTFEDDLGAGDSIVLALDLAANSGLSHHFATPLFSGEDAADLLVTTSAGNVKICAVGYEI